MRWSELSVEDRFKIKKVKMPYGWHDVVNVSSPEMGYVVLDVDVRKNRVTALEGDEEVLKNENRNR